jgi:hypothetical protein
MPKKLRIALATAAKAHSRLRSAIGGAGGEDDGQKRPRAVGEA